MSSSHLTTLALGLAATALVVAAYSAYSSWTRPQAVAAPTDISELEAELDAARSRLGVVERRLAVAERNMLLMARRDDDDESVDVVDSRREGAPESDDGDDDESERGPDRETTPKFVEFEVAQSGLDIRQNDNGSLSVRNTNPDLANQILVVKARGEDGRAYDLPITVPPVE